MGRIGSGRVSWNVDEGKSYGYFGVKQRCTDSLRGHWWVGGLVESI